MTIARKHKFMEEADYNRLYARYAEGEKSKEYTFGIYGDVRLKVYEKCAILESSGRTIYVGALDMLQAWTDAMLERDRTDDIIRKLGVI